MTTKTLTLLVLAVVLAVALYPQKVTCGAPANTCAAAPDEDGNISYYYVYEPLAVALLENVTTSDIELNYTDGFEKR